MVTINCAGVPESLLESELFGHVRGSFTDAHRDRRGILEAAHHGTVLLDEIGEMGMRMQTLLLRFLETGEIQRVGADQPEKPLDVRLIAATNRDLWERDPEEDVPRGSLLPLERRAPGRAAAARTAGGHQAAARPLPEARQHARRPAAAGADPRGPGVPRGLPMAGQRPRTEERRRASRGRLQRRAVTLRDLPAEIMAAESEHRARCASPSPLAAPGRRVLRPHDAWSASRSGRRSTSRSSATT